MKTYNELARLTKKERFIEIFNFVTTGIKTNAYLRIVEKSLLGIQDEEVLSCEKTFTISELSCKGFLSVNMCNVLIELAKVKKGV